MNEAYIKCKVCGKILDPETEAMEHKGSSYCFDHYEEVITEEQNDELLDYEKAQKICGFYEPQKGDFCRNPRTFCLICSKNKCTFKDEIEKEN